MTSKRILRTMMMTVGLSILPLFFISSGNFAPLATPLFAQGTKDAKLPKLYVHKVKTGNGIPQAIEGRVKNGIILSVLNNFRGKYAIVDDEAIATMYKQVAKMQASGCSEEKCIQQIADAIDADEIISAEITSEAGRYHLTLKNQERNAKALQFGTKSIVTETFLSFQTDYFVAEMAHAAVDPSYKVNVKGAPMDFEGHIDVARIEMKPVEGSEINIMAFKTDDQQAQNIIDALKDTLQNGEDLFKKESYSEALKQFEILHGVLHKRLTEETQIKTRDYMKGIEARMQNTNGALYRKKIEDVDGILKKEKEADENFLGKVRGKYVLLINDYQNTLPESQTPWITEALNDRIEKVDVAVYSLREKNGDQFYNQYKFTEALNIYKGIQSDASKQSIRKDYNDVREKMKKKIEAAETTGLSYLQNRVTEWCHYVEKENINLGVAIAKGNSSEEKKHTKEIEIFLNKALDYLENSAFVDENIIKVYESAYALVNKDGKKVLGKELSHGLKAKAENLAYEREKRVKEDALRKQWQTKGKQMKYDLDVLLATENKKSFDVNVKSYEDYLVKYSTDNPVTNEDDELRQKAEERRDFLNNKNPMFLYRKQMVEYRKLYDDYTSRLNKCEYEKSEEGHQASCENWLAKMQPGSQEDIEQLRKKCYNSHPEPFSCLYNKYPPVMPQKPK